ncbi:MAG TPA: aminotransferase class V-fold PLP-dependent enzyme [Stellaceae bacterium]|nr:aminotransferase class V-fold PLP-dependent enzyme [Stellaceae bacterium]
MSAGSGRHFLQIPGPTNVPDRILRAIDRPTIDHRGPEFAALAKSAIAGMKRICRTKGALVVFPSSGTGAWEAALVNTLSPGDKVLAFETGQFAVLWRGMAERFGLEVEFVPMDWRHPVEAEDVEARLTADRAHAIKAVMIVHNETSTGVTSDIAAIRRAIDRARHPALYLVDAISSLGATQLDHDACSIDVTIAGAQKGLMLPPGLGFNAISAKALAASKTAKLPRAYWDWQPMLAAAETGFFPFTPATNLLYGLIEAVAMLEEEGLEAVFARHRRLAEATRRAVAAWGLDTMSVVAQAHSNALTAVLLPERHDADAFRRVVLERFNLSLGAGLGRLAGKAFRIGHLGWLNELMLMATLAGLEMGFGVAGVPHRRGGVDAAMEWLAAGEQAVSDRAAAGRR